MGVINVLSFSYIIGTCACGTLVACWVFYVSFAFYALAFLVFLAFSPFISLWFICFSRKWILYPLVSTRGLIFLLLGFYESHRGLYYCDKWFHIYLVNFSSLILFKALLITACITVIISWLRCICLNLDYFSPCLLPSPN